MAKQRWATFSVADHLDLRALVPDVLLFDRLVFPYPADQDEEANWAMKKWDPKLLQYCLVELAELVYPVEWGEGQHQEFDSNMERAANIDKLPVSPVKWKGDKVDDAKRWEIEKYMTRSMLRDKILEERGADYLVMPCYRSQEAFLKDQKMRITPADSNSRREALAMLVGQKMRVPDAADPKVALKLATNLARDAGYQRCRRALFNWQETVIQRDQSIRDDAQELDDLISDLNNYIATQKAKERSQWIFFVLKRLVSIPELAHPLGTVKTAIEIGEFVSDRGGEMVPGAMAAFHHIRERVIEASVARGVGR